MVAYHGVPDVDPFSAQIDWLCDHTSIVSPEQFRRHLLEGEPLGDHPVLLTFDDGDRTVLDVAALVLGERGIPAVAFVVAGLVDTDQPFWWVEVEELVRAGAVTDRSSGELVRHLKTVPDLERRSVLQGLRDQVGDVVRTPQLTSDELVKLELGGVSIGNHSMSHPCLDSCDDPTLVHEVEESHRLLTEMLGHPPVAFAYPNGNHDSRVRSVVEACGYDMAFAFDHRMLGPAGDPLAVSRVRVDSWANLDRFKILVSGLHPRLHELRSGRWDRHAHERRRS